MDRTPETTLEQWASQVPEEAIRSRVIQLQAEINLLRAVLNMKGRSYATVGDRILDFLDRDGVGIREINEHVRPYVASDVVTRNALIRLRDLGLVKRVGRGVYALA